MHYLDYMRDLIKLAVQNPQLPFAAMIVDATSGNVLCTAVNTTQVNPIWHGEVRVIHDCKQQNANLDWSKTILITIAEPCPMCMSAIIWADIPIVVYGTSIQYLIAHHWPQIKINSAEMANKAEFYHGEIIGGVCHEETDELFKGGYLRE